MSALIGLLLFYEVMYLDPSLLIIILLEGWLLLIISLISIPILVVVYLSFLEVAYWARNTVVISGWILMIVFPHQM